MLAYHDLQRFLTYENTAYLKLYSSFEEFTMWFSLSILSSILLLGGASSVLGAPSWGFEDATISVQSKGAGIGGGFKEKLTQFKALSRPVLLGASDTLKIILTTQEDKIAKRPHQAFLNIKDVDTQLETSYPLAVKETGKGKVELIHKELPAQFLLSSKPLDVTLIIASFGSSVPYNRHIFDLSVRLDPNAPLPAAEKPLRYGKLPEIHHTFKADPKSPPQFITKVFTAAVVAALPLLLGTWVSLGANLNHLPRALQTAPVAHAMFYGSILALEGIFFMYYTSWNLFQTLPAAAGAGLVMFLSGSRALSEVQERRFAGLR